MVTIALDMMSGDGGLPVIAEATRTLLASNADTRYLLVGRPEDIRSSLSEDLLNDKRVEIVSAEEVITMEDSLSEALRRKRNASMRVAIDCVKEGRADACVSSGNTGAMMAIGRMVLKMIPGVERPALLARFPTYVEDHSAFVLDLGANVDVSSPHLVQFAVMGSIFASIAGHIQSPRVALLNVGTEAIKGNDLVKAANMLLEKQKQLNYVGYTEGDHVFSGDIDVVVCDGFVGNIMLKAAEGIAKLIGAKTRKVYKSSLPKKLLGLISTSIFKSLREEVNPSHYNGAVLIGLNGIVMKSHGSANAVGFAAAVQSATEQAKANLVERVKSQIEGILLHE